MWQVKRAFLGLVLTCMSATAFAQLYGGVGVAASRAKINDSSINSQLVAGGATSATTSKNEDSMSYKLFGGYAFNPNIALELGYFDLGKFSFDSTTVPAGSLHGDFKASGGFLDVVGTLPLSNGFSLFGRLGGNYAQTKDNFSGTGAIVVLNRNPSKSEFNYKVGLGGQYDFNKSMGVRAEWERYRISDGVGGKGDVDVFGASLVVRF